MKIKSWKGALVFLMLGTLLLLGAGKGTETHTEEISYSAFWELAEKGEIASVAMGDGENWKVEMKNGTLAYTPNPRAENGKERLLALDIQVKEQPSAAPEWLYGGLLLGALLLFMRLRSRGSSGLSKYAAVSPEKSIPGITFADVAVPEETLSSMRDLVGFLREPGKYARYGARLPRGVMLYGPPGTGKTLLARALAGEAGVPFFAMGGADFVQVYVGVGASRVRELFRRARRAGGGVIFIDEIDAIGKKRDNGNDEREQTLNALLAEMSGFSETDGILVLAATNRLDTLDAALLREGRFDRRIEVNLPDYAQRLQILRVHAGKQPLGDTVSLERLARQTTLFSGAQLETLLNEAAIRAARKNAEKIEGEDVESAFLAVAVGEERKRPASPEEKRITAYHEAGHALITRCMLPEAQLHRVTILPSSRGAAGYSFSVQPDRLFHTRRELMAMLSAALGGRAAEEGLLGPENVTTGAAGDLKKAREIARSMAEEWAMGRGEGTEKDMRAIEQEAMEAARACLERNREVLERVAQALLQRETLGEEELLSLTEGAVLEENFHINQKKLSCCHNLGVN